MDSGPRALVGTELRVHGKQVLRVVAASIMPRPVRGNTSAPVIVIAEKAADTVKAAAPIPKRENVCGSTPAPARIQARYRPTAPARGATDWRAIGP
ncbi:MAG: hypothetical protein H7274_12825 [Rhodoferax sp.]|nr:hypothetical protein [Rhodoferax sp.]